VDPYPVPSSAVTTQLEVVAEVLAFQLIVIELYPKVDIVNSKYLLLAVGKHAEAVGDVVDPPKYETDADAVNVGDPIAPELGFRLLDSKLNEANVVCPHPTPGNPKSIRSKMADKRCFKACNLCFINICFCFVSV
jgi:hypothetical protein